MQPSHSDKPNVKRTKVILYNNFVEAISSCGKFFDNSKETEQFLKRMVDCLLKKKEVSVYEKFGEVSSCVSLIVTVFQTVYN